MNATPPETVTLPLSALHLVRLALACNYCHFGFLKFYPDLSSAEVIAGYTAQRLTLYAMTPETALFCIAVMECVIGCGFLFNVLLRWVAPVFVFHMVVTFLPLLVFPEVCFKFAPLAPTLVGQYILKNLVLLSAGWLVLGPWMPRRAKTKPASKPLEPTP